MYTVLVLAALVSGSLSQSYITDEQGLLEDQNFMEEYHQLTTSTTDSLEKIFNSLRHLNQELFEQIYPLTLQIHDDATQPVHQMLQMIGQVDVFLDRLYKVALLDLAQVVQDNALVYGCRNDIMQLYIPNYTLPTIQGNITNTADCGTLTCYDLPYNFGSADITTLADLVDLWDNIFGSLESSYMEMATYREPVTSSLFDMRLLLVEAARVVGRYEARGGKCQRFGDHRLETSIGRSGAWPDYL